MKPSDSMPHSQELSNIQYPVPFPCIIPSYLISILMLSFHLRLGLHKTLFPASLPVEIFKALLSTSYEVPHFGAFATPHSHLSLAQIFASVSSFQISLPYINIYIVFNKIRTASYIRSSPRHD